MKYKNIIFDVDGTLLETLPEIIRAVNDTLKVLNYNKSFDVENGRSLIGHGSTYLIKKCLEGYDVTDEAVLRFEEVYFPYYKKYQDDSKLYDGVSETLRILHNNNVRLFILTNKPDPLMKILFNRYFKADVEGFWGDKHENLRKPDSMLTKAFCEEFKIDVNETLYVGDSIVDVELGENVGMDVCLCAYGYGCYEQIDKNRVKYKIDNFKELLEIVR